MIRNYQSLRRITPTPEDAKIIADRLRRVLRQAAAGHCEMQTAVNLAAADYLHFPAPGVIV